MSKRSRDESGDDYEDGNDRPSKLQAGDFPDLPDIGDEFDNPIEIDIQQNGSVYNGFNNIMPKGRKYGKRRKMQGIYQYLARTPAGQDSEQLQMYGSTYRKATPEQRVNRVRNGFRGRGGFFGDAWSGIKKGLSWGAKNFGARALGMAGGAYGGPAGAALGLAAGKALGMGRYDMRGRGEYEQGVVDNAIIHGGEQSSMQVSSVNADDSGDLIYSHSEFISNVTASGAPGSQSEFEITTYSINPALTSTFPFLSQIAQNYTMYTLEGCIFTYKPTSGESGGTSNQLGKIIMATDYDPQATPFFNAVQMSNYQYSASTKPSMGMRHGVETATKQAVTNMLYTRTGPVTRDKTFTDVGLFELATEGIPIPPITAGVQTTQTVILGELWVSYRVRLSRANLYASLLGFNIKADFFDYSLSTIPESSAITKQLVPGIVNNNLLTNFAKVPNTIGCTVRINAAAANSGQNDFITIFWPENAILGTYKITCVYTNLAGNGTSANPSQNPGYDYIGATNVGTGNQGLCPIMYVSQSQVGYGKTFTPFRGVFDNSNTTGNVVGTSSTLFPAATPSSANPSNAGTLQQILAASSNQKSADTGVDNRFTYQNTYNTIGCVTYFQLNAPGNNVAFMNLIIGSQYPNSQGYLANNETWLQTTGNLQISVEQVSSLTAGDQP